MRRDEFLTWIEFYKLYPFDDMHRYYRPAAMIAHSAASVFGPNSVTIQQRLDYLQPSSAGSSASNEDDYSEADLNTFKAFGITPPKKGK